jgi:hypothetical protein
MARPPRASRPAGGCPAYERPARRAVRCHRWSGGSRLRVRPAPVRGEARQRAATVRRWPRAAARARPATPLRIRDRRARAVCSCDGRHRAVDASAARRRARLARSLMVSVLLASCLQPSRRLLCRLWLPSAQVRHDCWRVDLQGLGSFHQPDKTCESRGWLRQVQVPTPPGGEPDGVMRKARPPPPQARGWQTGCCKGPRRSRPARATPRASPAPRWRRDSSRVSGRRRGWWRAGGRSRSWCVRA